MALPNGSLMESGHASVSLASNVRLEGRSDNAVAEGIQ